MSGGKGRPPGVSWLAGPPGGTCSGHEIRDNDIRIAEIPLPQPYPDRLRDFFFGAGADGPAVAGIGIRLVGEPGGEAGPPAGRVTEVVVEANRIEGASGLGIQLLRASGNRILDNHVAGIRPRVPLTGPTWGDDPTLWGAANGAGVWISAGSDANHLEGNTFGEIEGPAVWVDGAENAIVFEGGGAAVEDRGRSNRIHRR